MQLPRRRPRLRHEGVGSRIPMDGANTASASSFAEEADLGDDAGIPTVYWRPGCPFCAMLFRGLDRAGIPYRKVDIWADPRAAEHLRSVARGNETVPTVVFGAHALVNPRVSQVRDLLDQNG